LSAFKIRQVKKEIRTLGLAAKSTGSGGEFLVVGVVFRGSLWLDGVMRTTANTSDITDGSAEMIATSRHHPQIRAILVHGDLLYDGCTDPFNLSRKTMRPVIALNYKGDLGSDEPDNTQVYAMDVTGEEPPSYSIGLECPVAVNVLRTISRDGVFPEALRVARVLLSYFTEQSNISFKNDSAA
jgi:endonuclease V-like protein UPF0215 family